MRRLSLSIVPLVLSLLLGPIVVTQRALSADEVEFNLAKKDRKKLKSGKSHKKGERKRGKGKKRSGDDVSEEDSASPRMGKTFEIAGELGYLSGLMYGARAGFLVSPDLIIEGGFVMSKDVKSGYGSKTQMLEGRAKVFFGSMIYGAFGLGYRIYTDTTQAILLSGVEDYNEFKRADVGVDLGLGAQWHFSSFTIGADMIGLYFPILKMSQVGDPSPGLDTATQEEVASDFNKKASAGNIHLLRVYAGMMF